MRNCAAPGPSFLCFGNMINFGNEATTNRIFITSTAFFLHLAALVNCCPCWRCSPERTGRALWSPSRSLWNLATAVKVDIDLTYASPIIGPDGSVYVASLNGDLRVFQREPCPATDGGDFWQSDCYTYNLVWRNATFPSTPIIATPAIAVGITSSDYTVIATAGSVVVGVGASGAGGDASTFAESWRIDLCGSARIAAAWVAQFGGITPCALQMDASPAVSLDGSMAFVCGYGGDGPQLGVCVALRTRDGGEQWASFINLAGFRLALIAALLLLFSHPAVSCCMVAGDNP